MNPNHDEMGRFASGGGTTYGGKSYVKQKAAIKAANQELKLYAHAEKKFERLDMKAEKLDKAMMKEVRRSPKGDVKAQDKRIYAAERKYEAAAKVADKAKSVMAKAEDRAWRALAKADLDGGVDIRSAYARRRG